jgi:hypothetical protein
MTSTHTHTFTKTETDEAPAEESAAPARHPSVEHLLRILAQEPRPPFGLGLIGRLFINLGQEMAKSPDNPELAVALRHLIDARAAYTRVDEAARPAPVNYSVSPLGGATVTFDFGHALAELRAGNSVTRSAWGPWGNSARHYLVLVPSSSIVIEADRPLGKANPQLVGKRVSYSEHIDVHTTGVTAEPTVRTWTPEAADLFALDWQVTLNGAR